MNTATQRGVGQRQLDPDVHQQEDDRGDSRGPVHGLRQDALRVSRRTRSWATSPQITEQVRHTRDSTPAPKLRKSANESSAVES